MKQRPQSERRILAYIQSADALRAVALMRREREQIDVHRLDVQWQFARALRRVDMKCHASLATNRAHCADILNHASLVIHMHERHQLRVRAQRFADLLGLHDAVEPWFQPSDLEPFTLQLLECIDHRFVFSARSDDVTTSISMKARDAKDRQVVRLGGAGRPDDGVRPGANGCRDLLSGLLNQRASTTTEFMAHRRWIAMRALWTQTFNHRFGDARIDGRRRGVVEVQDLRFRSRLSHMSWCVCAPYSLRCATLPAT